MRVNIDFETRSAADLRKVGLYCYAAHPTTQVSCLAYSIDGGEVQGWRIGQRIPPELLLAARHGAEFHAWNAQFERVIWREVLRRQWKLEGNEVPPLRRWHCSMALGGLHGLPLQLEKAAEAVGLAQGKDTAGGALMMRMCRPRGYDSTGWPVWWGDDERMERLLAYCQQDVRVEMQIAEKLTPMPASERLLYMLDQTINERGVGVDADLLFACLSMAGKATAAADAELDRITSGAVTGVNKRAALARWIEQQGVKVESLSKRAVEALQAGEIPDEVSQALTVRQEAAKSSVAKLETIRAYRGDEGRIRGLLQYAGAATGRWAGRGPQPHNFPRGGVPNAEQWIPAVLLGDIDLIDQFHPPLDVISSLLRAVLVPRAGRRFVAGDFAAIEARVLAWLAGQHDLLQLFATGGDVYKAMAAKIYVVPVDKVSKVQRQMGKTAILGLGFQMGPAKFVESCLAMAGVAIEEEFSVKVVRTYRDSNRKIVALWYALDDAAVLAVATGEAQVVAGTEGKLLFDREGDWLRLRLPSGRFLFYANPRLMEVDVPWDATTKKTVVVVDHWDGIARKWRPRKMYGGLWAENAVQATARDLLAQSMLRIEKAGYEVVLTVHDEVVTEREYEEGSVEEFERLMAETPEWAEGCPVSVEGWEGPRYRK